VRLVPKKEEILGGLFCRRQKKTIQLGHHGVFSKYKLGGHTGLRGEKGADKKGANSTSLFYPGQRNQEKKEKDGGNETFGERKQERSKPAWHETQQRGWMQKKTKKRGSS